MNAETLLMHFSRLAETPDAVPRLRRLVLDLAVRGKLVTQHRHEEPASELVKRIQAERPSHAGAAGVQAGLLVLSVSEVPYAVPAGWVWIRFGSIHDLVRGVTYTKADVSETQIQDHLPILRANNI